MSLAKRYHLPVAWVYTIKVDSKNVGKTEVRVSDAKKIIVTNGAGLFVITHRIYV